MAVDEAARALALGFDPMAVLRLPRGPEQLIFGAALERAEEYREHQLHELAEAVLRTLGS